MDNTERWLLEGWIIEVLSFIQETLALPNKKQNNISLQKFTDRGTGTTVATNTSRLQQ